LNLFEMKISTIGSVLACARQVASVRMNPQVPPAETDMAKALEVDNAPQFDDAGQDPGDDSCGVPQLLERKNQRAKIMKKLGDIETKLSALNPSSKKYKDKIREMQSQLAVLRREAEDLATIGIQVGGEVLRTGKRHDCSDVREKVAELQAIFDNLLK